MFVWNDNDLEMEIRKLQEQDIKGVKDVLDSSELFPSEYLDGMVYDYLNNPESEEVWFTTLIDNRVVGFSYCRPEELTEGTYNLLAIAVLKEAQGNGVGKRMIVYLEQLLMEKDVRILIVETSSDPQFILTRKFYKKLNYSKEAIIRDFWKDGEHKVVYWKKLGEEQA